MTGNVDPSSTSQGTRSIGLRSFQAAIRTQAAAAMPTPKEIMGSMESFVSISSISTNAIKYN
jgi:hypothetical protein